MTRTVVAVRPRNCRDRAGVLRRYELHENASERSAALIGDTSPNSAQHAERDRNVFDARACTDVQAPSTTDRCNSAIPPQSVLAFCEQPVVAGFDIIENTRTRRI